MNTFEQLGLQSSLLQAIDDLGFKNPSEIQEKAIPLLLQDDTDMVALAQTGTGKTAAFGFPMIQKIDPNYRATQALILSPTRELCLQITNELKLYSKYTPNLRVAAIYGGASITAQASEIKRGAQIVVATPGRMKDMIQRRMVDITEISYCVLDEADEMLNMGFYEDITDILSHTPEDKFTWLFSATMPAEVSRIAKKFMDTPVEVTVGAKNSGSANVMHEYYLVNARDRYNALKRLADANPDIFSVVFCRTKRDTQKVAEKLIEDGYNAGALHGDLSQNQRDMVMKAFRSNQIQMLVATDVAARGIDVDDVTHVINYQLPDETETYTHRSGRTGRAGKSGISMVIITKSELKKIRAIEKIIKKSFEPKSIPNAEEICEIQLYHLASKIKDTEVHDEVDTYLPAVMDVLEGLDRDELIKKMVSVEFSRFANYYSKTANLDQPVSGGNARHSDGSTRYFINVGGRDGYDWKTLKDFLRAQTGLERDDIYKVDVKDSFSFFNTESRHADEILQLFSEFRMDGRFVNVEISSNADPAGPRGKKNKGFRAKKSESKFKGKRRNNPAPFPKNKKKSRFGR